jgi:hypothetical protein
LLFYFREIYNRNLVGITINAQRQLEFGRTENECNDPCPDEEEEMIQHCVEDKPQSDV